MAMTEGIGPVQALAARVSEVRKRKDMTAAEVGRRMSDQGVRWDRFTVANLESGKRQNVTVTEWLTLARVLDVSPLHLLVPIGEVDYKVTPEFQVPASRVRAWVRGQKPLPGTDMQIFYTEAPLDEVRPTGRGRFAGRHGSVDLNAWASGEKPEDADSGE